MTTVEPGTDKGRATRDRVVDTATELVFEHGVAGTTLDDVRAAAKVSKGQLYHYFADKDDIVHAVIDRSVEQVLDAQPATGEPHVLDRDRRLVRRPGPATGRRHAIGGCPIGSLAGELAETDEVTPAPPSPPASTAGRLHCATG